jgi:predicted anti-sigma-YlaC factor YlaD
MNCNEVRENLIELLTPGQGQAAPAISAHVKQCSACSQELESLRKTMALLDEWKVPEPSPYFMTRMGARVREEREKKASARLFDWLRRPALAVSLATVLVVGGITYQVLRPTVQIPTPAGTAVGDLEALEKNHDLYVNSDLLDEVAGTNQPQQQQQQPNPQE